MKVSITITEDQLRALIIAHLSEKLNGIFNKKDLKIEVKSRQNYKAEWEAADFRATYQGEV